MKNLKIHDLEFTPFINYDSIMNRVKELSIQINQDYQNRKPIFLPILNGSFVFASDLIKEITIPCEVSFIKVTSYHGTDSKGEVDEVIGLSMDIRNRDIIIIEDIIDSGLTMHSLLKMLSIMNPSSVTVASLFVKPQSLEYDLNIRYVGFEIENKFILGYGLDYNQLGRNYKDIYQKI